MSIMTEEQVKLLHKLQMAEIPAFQGINPLSMTEDEASDFLRMNMPQLEWINAVAQDENKSFIEKRFIGVSENNCREQLNQWLDAEDLTLFQQPNPQFGSGEMWLEYFAQPLDSIKLKALTDHFAKWEIKVPDIPIPNEQQRIIRYTPVTLEQNIYTRLNEKELQQEIQNLQKGNSISAEVQLGFLPSDVNVFAEDTTFHTFLSPLKELTQAEWEKISKGENIEEITGQIQIDTVHSDVAPKPYYARLSAEELQAELEYFQTTGEFREGIDIGYSASENVKKGKSITPLVTELTDEELDLLENGKFSNLDKLKGQKLLGFSVSQNIPVFRRLTADELESELKTFAVNGKFSNSQISIGHIAERETHKKEFHSPLSPLSKKDMDALAKGESISSKNMLLAQKLVCRTPRIPGSPVYEKKFSALELAFDDCPIERQEIYALHRKERDEHTFNKITPENRATIKALQANGKGPKIEREEYLNFTRQDAENYIKENENNQENTFAPTAYPKRATPKAEAFPQYKKANLFSAPAADYLQRSIIKDLIAEGHLATSETVDELQNKLEFITSTQANALIDPYLETPAGAGLLDQCRAYIESGQIYCDREINTIGDAQKLYQTHRSFDYDKKAILRDLIADGHIKSNNAYDKIKFTTNAQDDALIAKYANVKIGNNLRAKIQELIDDAKIGSIEYEDFDKLSVKEGMRIVTQNAEIEKYKKIPRATQGQIDLLKKMETRGQIDLSKINVDNLKFKVADQLIKQNIKNPSRSQTPSATNVPATEKQRGLIKLLVSKKILPSIPYAEWTNLTMHSASKQIASIPPEILKQAMTQSPSRKNTHSKSNMER